MFKAPCTEPTCPSPAEGCLPLAVLGSWDHASWELVLSLLPMARVLAMQSSAVRRSGGVSVPSKELRNSFRHLHWHERILPFLNPAVPRAHAVVRLLCPYTSRICWSVESQTEAQGHSAQHQGPQIQHDDLNPALT